MNIQNQLSTNGNVWEKGTMKRIYIANKTLFINELTENNMNKLSDFEMKKIRESKIWWDAIDNKMHSDVGTVRVLLNSNGVECIK
jgi:hypothetical protein